MRVTIRGQALEPESSRFRLLSVRPHGGLLQKIFREQGSLLHKSVARMMASHRDALIIW
jgi:hypothetical protein